MDQRKKKRSSRRSSILKIGRSPPRGALCDLDPNAPLEDDTKKLRLSRRVSFAETCQVKEFIKDSWNNSNQKAPPGVEQSAGNINNLPQPVVVNENVEPGNGSQQTISGLDTLLNGQIKSRDSAENIVLELDIDECRDDDVFLSDGAELEIIKCNGQQSRNNNMTILQQSSMDLTCMNNFPGSSVSNVGNLTTLSGSDMDMTACVTPNVPSNATKEPESKLSSATFLENMGYSSAAMASSDATTTDSQFAPGEVQPKINVSQFLAKISGQQSRSSRNMTILSQSSMDLTCMNNFPGSSVSSVGSLTTLSGSDMDMTACVTPNIPNPVPGIMITRPSTSVDEPTSVTPNVPSNATEEPEFKFSSAAFLEKMGSSSAAMASCDATTTGSQFASDEVQPKINVSQFLAKISDSSTTTQVTSKPVIYVPDRPSNNGTNTVPKDPYTLSNETDFDTMINTSVNKYTGLPHVTTSTDVKHTTVHCSYTDGRANNQLSAVVEKAYENWSTETTRVFGTGNTSRMEMTLVSGNETIHNANPPTSQQFASKLQSSLDRVAQVEDQTRIFTGDEDTADMDFTACLTTNLGQVKSRGGYNTTSENQIAPSLGDVTKCVDTEMEFTLCNITIKNHPVTTDNESGKVSTRAFLEKLTNGNISVVPETGAVDIIAERENDTGSTNVKIDSQAFLSKLTTIDQSAEVINQSGTSHVDPASEMADKTVFFGNQDNMEFTTCITQTLKDINCVPPVQETSPPMTDKTQIFSSNEENMEFTTCITQAMADVRTASANKDHSPPATDKTKIFNIDEENMEFTACITQTMQKANLTRTTNEDFRKIADQTRIFEEDNMEFTTCLQGMQNQQVQKDTEMINGGNIPAVDVDTEDSEIVFKKKPVENNLGLQKGEDNAGIEYPKSRKRSHETVATETDTDKVNTSSQDEAAHHVQVTENPTMMPQVTTQDLDMISDEAEPKFPDSPAVKDQEVTTGLRGLMSRVKKARKSIGTGEPISVFNTDATLGQMDLTRCAGGIESQESTAKFTAVAGAQQHDLTRHFQNDDLTSAMELTKCVTSTLPSLRERLNVVSGKAPMSNSDIEQAKTSGLNNSNVSSENIDIMNEMPPSLIEISINADTDTSEETQSQFKEGQAEAVETLPAPANTQPSDVNVTFNISVEEVRDESMGQATIPDMDFTEIRELDETKSEKSRLYSAESEITTCTKNHSKSSMEDTSKESLLLSVATMNKTLGQLPANLSCLEPKVTKGLSFVDKSQLSLCDEPPKNIDDFLSLLGFHSYNERLCRRSTLAPYSMKAPETLGEHLELASIIEPQVQVYEWACGQMETMTKKIQSSNDEVGTTLLSNLPQPLIDVVDPQISSKVKQTYKPIIRSCKLKAEQTIKDWRTKMVNSEMDALQQEVQLMDKGVQELKDAITSVDKQLDNIISEKSKLWAILGEIEKEEPASDEQVQQLEDCEEQLVVVTADLEEMEANREPLESKLDCLRKENIELTKQTEELRSKITHCETPPAPTTSLDALHDHIDDIHLWTEWQLKSISDDRIVVSWLFKSLDMEIELAPSSSKTPHNRYLTKINFVSQLSESAEPWAFLAQRMVTEAVSTRALDEKYPTTKYLGQMLEELSPIVWNARVLGDEMSDTCLFHDTVIDGCMATVKFASLAAFARFTVTFKLQPGKYPNEPVKWELDCDVGDLRREDLEPVFSACTPGQLYMHRLVQSIQNMLEKRAQDLKLQG